MSWSMLPDTYSLNEPVKHEKLTKHVMQALENTGTKDLALEIGFLDSANQIPHLNGNRMTKIFLISSLFKTKPFSFSFTSFF